MVFLKKHFWYETSLLQFFSPIVVQLKLSPYSPPHISCHTHPCLPSSNPHPLVLSECLSYMFLHAPPYYHLLSLSPLNSSFCQIFLSSLFSVCFLFIVSLTLKKNCCSSTVASLFSPLLPPTQPSPLTPLIQTPFSFVHVHFIDIPEIPSTSPPPPYALLPHSGYCQYVLYFSFCSYILIACLFC